MYRRSTVWGIAGAALALGALAAGGAAGRLASAQPGQERVVVFEKFSRLN